MTTQATAGFMLAPGEPVSLRRSPASEEAVRLVGVCPCGHEYESGDIATERQLENLVRHWRAIGFKCGLCEWTALEEAD